MSRRALLAVPDLFFFTRIESVARQIGVAIEACPIDALVEACAARPPDLVVLDLHAPGDPIARARELKSAAATSAIPIVAFYSHVDGALRARAIEAGIERVLPRSAFSARLADWLAAPVE